jgi:hypothetical protein
MRILLGLTFSILASTVWAFAEETDIEKLARPERAKLAGCMSDTLAVVEKHRLVGSAVGLWKVLEVTCGIEIERVKRAAESELRDDLYKKVLPGQIVFSMFETASDILEKRPQSSCSGTGCSLSEYRRCLMRQMPPAIKQRNTPIVFETQSQQACEESESGARNALTNDFDEIQIRHLAHGLDHKTNDLIRETIVLTRQSVVVLYAEDLVRVQPKRKSCRPEMCGASPCLSLSDDEPTEYQCVINQK